MKIKLNEKVKKGITATCAVLTIVSLGVLGGSTYSKYFTKIDGEGSATVARWSFKANNERETIANVKLSNTYNQNKLLENTIAPGTNGSFDIVLDATGADVAIDYAVTFENCKDKPTNLKFYYGGITSSTLEGLEYALQGRISLDNPRTRTLTIEWFWDYETGEDENTKAINDEIDTKDSGKTFTFDVNITGTQVNPEELES